MRSTVDIEVRKIVVPEGRMRPVNAARMEVLLDSIRKIRTAAASGRRSPQHR